MQYPAGILIFLAAIVARTSATPVPQADGDTPLILWNGQADVTTYGTANRNGTSNPGVISRHLSTRGSEDNVINCKGSILCNTRTGASQQECDSAAHLINPNSTYHDDFG